MNDEVKRSLEKDHVVLGVIMRRPVCSVCSQLGIRDPQEDEMTQSFGPSHLDCLTPYCDSDGLLVCEQVRQSAMCRNLLLHRA